MSKELHRSKLSAGTAIINTRPPAWSLHYIEDDSLIKNLNFKNLYVYNFYTQEERIRYNYKNSTFDQRNVNPALRTEIFDITGQKLESDIFNRVASEHVPAYIKLSWDMPEGQNDASMIADISRIDAFKALAGLSSFVGDAYNFTPLTIENFENFELMQIDYVNVTNEYLDMFSFDEEGQLVNNWFAEELDSSGFVERQQFIHNKLIGNTTYKNFLHISHGQRLLPIMNFNPDKTTTTPFAEHPNGCAEFSNSPNIKPVSVVATVNVRDSALLENLNYPSDKALPEDLTVALNTTYMWTISRASTKSSGLLLGMQSRVRSIRHWQEFLNKQGIKKGTSVEFNDLQGVGNRINPLERVLSRAHPYEVEDVNVHGGSSLSDFKIVGFIIEKEQRVEFNEVDEVRSRTEKFPFIFIPCATTHIPTSYLDAAVNYDKEYNYTVRTVYTFSVTVSHGGGRTYHFFVNSPYSTVLTIETREVTPPSFPRDLWAFYEFHAESPESSTSGALALHWAFPIDRQRDTTYFAIFRRKTIYEPFNLLRIYDFNYSISSPQQSREEIKAVLEYRHLHGADIEPGTPLSNSYDKVVRLSFGQPNTMYKDRRFEADTDYIYTVCSIDAHGQMSNYGAQIKVYLNSKTNKLSVRQISPPGAPLVFPNWFVESRAFQDVARTSRYRRAVLRFRPDYKSIALSPHNDRGSANVANLVKGMRAEDGGDIRNCYYLQIINPDRADDIVLKYQIDDRFELAENSENQKLVANLMGMRKAQIDFED